MLVVGLLVGTLFMKDELSLTTNMVAFGSFLSIFSLFFFTFSTREFFFNSLEMISWDLLMRFIFVFSEDCIKLLLFCRLFLWKEASLVRFSVYVVVIWEFCFLYLIKLYVFVSRALVFELMELFSFLT